MNYSLSIYRHTKMSTIQDLAMLIGAIKGFQSGANGINVISEYRLVPRPILLVMSIISFIIEIFIHLFMAYKFPLLYISWFIISDPFYRKQIISLYKKIVN